MKPILFFLLTIAISAVAELKAQELVNDYQQFMKAYDEKDFAKCAQVGLPLANATNHPGIQYKLAECLCQLEQTDQSLALLLFLTRRQLTYKPEDKAGFAPLYNNKRFQEYTEAFRKNRAAVERSSTSFVVNDSLLIPEGIAYDHQRKTFYIGSLAKNKVIICSENGICSDFVTGNDAGFWMVVGMKVSADNNSLWICSASERPGTSGLAGIFQFEIPSGKLLKKYTVDNKDGDHLFNDLDFTKAGDVYFTDSKAGKVWRIAPGSDTLTAIATGYVYPNGIAIDEANNAVFVADFMGLNMINIHTGKQSKISDQNMTYLNGIDGLYFHNGALIGIQDSGNQDDRIVKFKYDVKKAAITGVEILQSFRPDFITPTTGTFANGDFHFIANAQLRSLQPDGSLVNPEKLVKPLILKLSTDTKVINKKP